MATTLSRRRSDASVTAWPIIGPLRLPPVPGPKGALSVSPWRTVTSA